MNKIKFGLSKCYYAKKSVSGYGTPVALPGAVSLSLDPQGELYKFYADNIEYFRNAVNNGYAGDLELALVPESFAKDILGESLDSTDKVLVEQVLDEATEFALGFQIEGDQNASRFWVYNCVATRPGVSGATKEDKIEAQTEKLTISSSPTADGYVRARTTSETPSAIYDAWFTEVWEPAAATSTS